MGISDYSATRDLNSEIAPGNMRTRDDETQQIINSIRQLMADLADLVGGTEALDLLLNGSLALNGTDRIFNVNGGAFVTNTGSTPFDISGANIDHIWHNDAPSDVARGEWTFCSDGDYQGSTLEDLGCLRASTMISGSVTISDDSVASIPAPMSGGFFICSLAGRGDFPQLERSGIAMFDVGSSVSARLVGGGPNFAVTAGNPTGTTGTNGNVTMGVTSNTVRLENRYGSTQTFYYTFIG